MRKLTFALLTSSLCLLGAAPGKKSTRSRYRKLSKKRVRGLPHSSVVLLPAGTFQSGTSLREPQTEKSESPWFSAQLTRPFWIMTTEVTQGQYKHIMGKNPSVFTRCGPKCPVERVSWLDAVRFANTLSKRHKLETCYVCTKKICRAKKKYRTINYNACRGWRLPTESEWQYAAKAGTKTALYTGHFKRSKTSINPSVEPIAWYLGNSVSKYKMGFRCLPKHFKGKLCGTQPVAKKKPNPWGLYDMLGNVFEYVYDGYGSYKDYRRLRRSKTINPVVLELHYKVKKGCGWRSPALLCRPGYRASAEASMGYFDIGFRLVRTHISPRK